MEAPGGKPAKGSHDAASKTLTDAGGLELPAPVSGSGEIILRRTGYTVSYNATMKLASIGDRIGEHKSSGRDLGVQVQGDLFKAHDGHHWFHYQVGIFNGQGINHADKDRTKDFIGGAWISPVKNLSIGGFGWSGRYVNEKFTDPTKQLPATRRDRWGVGLKYEDKWTVRGEYMSSKGGIVTNFARTMAAWGIYKITCEDEVKKLANSMLYTLNKLPLRYKEWDNTLLAYKNKCESLAAYFGVSMPYRHGVRKS